MGVIHLLVCILLYVAVLICCVISYSANVNSRSRSRYVAVRPSVCRLSVGLTFVRLTQAIEIFGNVSTPFFTLAIPDFFVNTLLRSSRGTPPSGFKPRRIAKYSDFDLWKAISRKRCKICYKLLLITNRKYHMSFRLLPNSATLNNLERRNSPNGCVISPNSVTFSADYVKVVQDTPILSTAEI